MKTILIVDSDLGFAFWLGHALDRAGYQALPARSVADGISLIDQLKLVLTLLVIRASLPSVAAFAASLREQFGPDFKVIGVIDQDSESGALPWADAEALRPEHIDDIAEEMWLQRIRSLAVPERKNQAQKSIPLT